MAITEFEKFLGKVDKMVESIAGPAPMLRVSMQKILNEKWSQNNYWTGINHIKTKKDYSLFIINAQYICCVYTRNPDGTFTEKIHSV